MVTTAELALQATRLMAVSAVLVRWKRIHWVVVLDGEVLAMEVTACISALQSLLSAHLGHICQCKSTSHQTGHVRLDTPAVTKLYHVTVKVDHCGMENAAVHHVRYVNEH